MKSKINHLLFHFFLKNTLYVFGYAFFEKAVLIALFSKKRLYRMVLEDSAADVDAPLLSNIQYPTPDDLLTKEERATLKELNSKADTAQSEMTRKTNLMEMSVKEILHNWSNAMQNILRDTVEFAHYDRTIRESSNFYDFIVLFVSNLWDIFTRDDRITYSGITLLILGFVGYFVFISE